MSVQTIRIAAIDIQADGEHILFLEGGNSPNSFRQVSAAYLLADDLDRFGGADDHAPGEGGEK